MTRKIEEIPSALPRSTRRGAVKFLTGAIAAISAFRANATIIGWPARPIWLVVPFAAGGPPDLVARAIAEPLAQEVRGTIVVENKAGAGGTPGVIGVARSEPDGYTLLIGTSAYILNKALNPQILMIPSPTSLPYARSPTHRMSL